MDHDLQRWTAARENIKELICWYGLPSTAQDLQMTAYPERQLKIPSHFSQSKLRLNIILVSKATKQPVSAGDDSSLGGYDGGATEEKERELPGAGEGLSEKLLEDRMHASGGQQLGFRHPLLEQDL